MQDRKLNEDEECSGQTVMIITRGTEENRTKTWICGAFIESTRWSIQTRCESLRERNTGSFASHALISRHGVR